MQKGRIMNNSFNIDLSEADLREYVLNKAKNIIKNKEEYFEMEYKCELDPLRIVGIEDGTIELGFAAPRIEKPKYDKLAAIAERKFGKLLENAFLEITKHEYTVHIMPIEIQEE